jgi:hypothetical protein
MIGFTPPNHVPQGVFPFAGVPRADQPSHEEVITTGVPKRGH